VLYVQSYADGRIGRISCINVIGYTTARTGQNMASATSNDERHTERQTDRQTEDIKFIVST